MEEKCESNIGDSDQVSNNEGKPVKIYSDNEELFPMQKLVFFFPWPEVSGGPFYLCRLADAVARTGLYEVYYTDY